MNEQAQAIIDYIEARLEEALQPLEDPTARPGEIAPLAEERRAARDVLLAAFEKPTETE